MKKNMFRLTTVLAAAALAAGLMGGCSTVPSSGDSTAATATDTVLILEQGDGMPALTDPENFTESINTTLNGSATLIIADGNPQVLGPIRFNDKKNNAVQQEKADKKMKAAFVEIIKNAKAQTPETDLLSSIALAARALNAGTAETKQLIIRHSGISTAASYPMQEIDLVNEDPAALVDKLEEAAMIPQLDGIQVDFYGMTDVAGSQPVLSARQTAAIKAFWEEYFKRTNAASVNLHTDILTGDALMTFGHTITPMMPDDGIHFVKVTSEEVSFKPDSTEFADEAAASAALNSLAEQLKNSSSAYVIAGSVAKVDGGTEQGAQNLSLARANAVRDCLVAAGVESDALTCVGLGFEATSCRSTVEEENRCVYVVSSDTAKAAEFLTVGQAES